MPPTPRRRPSGTPRLLVWALLLTVVTGACQPAPQSQPTARPPASALPSNPPPAASPAPPTTSPTALPSPTAISPATAIPLKISDTPAPLETTRAITTTLLFTGIIVPARCVQAKLDIIGNPNYPYEEVREIIAGADLAIGTFNASMSARVERTGCLTTWQLVGDPNNADAAAWAGFDLMSVATNHIKDCGLMKSWCDHAFLDTLENLQRVGIETVGGGRDLEEALQPLVMEVNGVRFAFVALGDSKMDPVVFAGQDHPGIARLVPENIQAALEKAHEVAEVVIALPHWGPEDSMVPNWGQIENARRFVEGGADLVVGNHTHVVQAIKEIEGVPVFYGLGNFVFDQGLRDHRQGYILQVDFRGTELVGYRLIPTHTDADGRVHLAGLEEAAEILENIQQASWKTP